jgi:hypothetical protein
MGMSAQKREKERRRKRKRENWESRRNIGVGGMTRNGVERLVFAQHVTV